MGMTKEHEGKPRVPPNESVHTVATTPWILSRMFRTALMMKKHCSVAGMTTLILDTLAIPSRHARYQLAYGSLIDDIPFLRPLGWGGFGRCETDRWSMSHSMHRCSIGFKSGDRAGYHDIDSFLIQVRYDDSVCSGIIVHQDGLWLHNTYERSRIWLEDFISVPHRC